MPHGSLKYKGGRYCNNNSLLYKNLINLKYLKSYHYTNFGRSNLIPFFLNKKKALKFSEVYEVKYKNWKLFKKKRRPWRLICWLKVLIRILFADKYAALWPFLGICAEVFVLCTIILIYEKKRNKSELEESDTDQSPDQ